VTSFDGEEKGFAEGKVEKIEKGKLNFSTYFTFHNGLRAERRNLVVNYNFLRKSPYRITSLEPINFPTDPFCLDEFSLVFPRNIPHKKGGKPKGVAFFCVELREMKITSQVK
jgi:hypothetical protein